jgi:signal transduction histidine kinase
MVRGYITEWLADRRLGRQPVDYRQALQSFSRELVTVPLELSAILERLIDQIVPVSHSAPIVVFLYDPGSGRYVVQQAKGFAVPEGQDISFGRDSGLAQWLGQQAGPICLLDNQTQVPLLKLSTGEQSLLQTLGLVLFLPLWGQTQANNAHDPLAGWVALGPQPSGKPYRPGDLSFLAALVDQTALAIENARLYASIQDANEARSDFIDFVAHELKQPMTAMQGYAKMMTMGIGGQLTEVQQGFVQVITANVDRMSKLVNDLLEISRLEAGRTKLKLAPIYLEKVVEETIAKAHTEIDARRHALSVEIADDLPPVMGDYDRLVQIVTNLVSNACKYTPDGGSIQVSVRGGSGADVPPGYLVVSIRDSGIGMSSEELLHLGDFFRADHDLVRTQPGTGVGVSIARNLVELHGGEFMVESEPGLGSTFRFTVPIADVSSPS